MPHMPIQNAMGMAPQYLNQPTSECDEPVASASPSLDLWDSRILGGTLSGTPLGVAVACWLHALRITSWRATLLQGPGNLHANPII